MMLAGLTNRDTVAATPKDDDNLAIIDRIFALSLEVDPSLQYAFEHLAEFAYEFPLESTAPEGTVLPWD